MYPQKSGGVFRFEMIIYVEKDVWKINISNGFHHGFTIQLLGNTMMNPLGSPSLLNPLVVLYTGIEWLLEWDFWVGWMLGPHDVGPHTPWCQFSINFRCVCRVQNYWRWKNRCSELARINSRIPADFVVYPFVSCWFGYPKVDIRTQELWIKQGFWHLQNRISIYPWLAAIDETTTVNSNLQLGTLYHWDKWSSICWNFTRDPLLISWCTATGLFGSTETAVVFCF